MFYLYLQTATWLTVLTFLVFIFTSVGVVSAMYDRWWWAPVVEVVRCAAYIAYARKIPVTDIPSIDTVLLVYFAMSLLLWTIQSLTVLRSGCKGIKLE